MSVICYNGKDAFWGYDEYELAITACNDDTAKLFGKVADIMETAYGIVQKVELETRAIE